MRKNYVILGLSAVAAFFFYKYEETSSALSTSQRVRLRTGMTMEEQSRCANQVASFVKSDRFPARDLSPKFTAIYNPVLDKCFGDIEVTSASRGGDGLYRRHRYLVDVFSGEYVGVCRWQWKSGQKPQEVSPFSCMVTDPTEHKQMTPKSEAEFQKDIEPYLEDR